MTVKKRLYFLSAVTLLFFLLLYLFLIRPEQKKFKASHLEVVKKIKVLRRFFTRPEGLPTEKEIGLIDNEIKVLKEKYIDIKKAFIHKAPEKVNVSPIKFGKILYETKKELLREAEKAGLEIPSALGFKETIPTEEEVEDMVKELRAITFVIREAIAFGFGDIKRISYPGIKVEDPWEKVGIELEVNGKFENIVGFLYSLGQKEKVYIIKSLEITRGGEKIIVSGTPKGMASPTRSGLEARALRPSEKKPFDKVDKVVKEGRVSVVVRLESYNYIAAHGN